MKEDSRMLGNDVRVPHVSPGAQCDQKPSGEDIIFYKARSQNRITAKARQSCSNKSQINKIKHCSTINKQWHLNWTNFNPTSNQKHLNWIETTLKQEHLNSGKNHLIKLRKSHLIKFKKKTTLNKFKKKYRLIDLKKNHLIYLKKNSLMHSKLDKNKSRLSTLVSFSWLVSITLSHFELRLTRQGIVDLIVENHGVWTSTYSTWAGGEPS